MGHFSTEASSHLSDVQDLVIKDGARHHSQTTTVAVVPTSHIALCNSFRPGVALAVYYSLTPPSHQLPNNRHFSSHQPTFGFLVCSTFSSLSVILQQEDLEERFERERAPSCKEFVYPLEMVELCVDVMQKL